MQLLLLKRRDNFFVLALGDEYLTVLDQFGSIVSVSKLENPVVDIVHVADVNQDGILDLVFTHENFYSILITKTHRGLSVLSFLTISLTAVVILMYISTFINLRDPFFEKSQQFSK
jgi:hypothetical protein